MTFEEQYLQEQMDEKIKLTHNLKTKKREIIKIFRAIISSNSLFYEENMNYILLVQEREITIAVSDA